MENEVIRHIQIPPAVRKIVLIWLVWFVVLFGYQALVPNRLLLYRPDYVLSWTPNETTAKAQQDNRYLIEPFMNAQVSWDSEYYLSIATVGYDDPQVRALASGPSGGPPGSATGKALSLNYAFFPFYPYAARAIAAPLRLLGLTPIATSTLAAVIVSLLGTLAAMLALYD
ncbi:MAG TPA: hypothetical protein VHO69_15860, partial [Phototrophicaceae bacterium]|nr:hypothetical protein [Phototrophicaceae bacterium]